MKEINVTGQKRTDLGKKASKEFLQHRIRSCYYTGICLKTTLGCNHIGKFRGQVYI